MMKHTHKYVKHELWQHHLQPTGMFWHARARACVFPFHVPNSEKCISAAQTDTYQRLLIYMWPDWYSWLQRKYYSPDL